MDNKDIFSMSPRELGSYGEYIAEGFLKDRNYSVLGKNWKTRFGEVDLIAQSPEGELVLIEVKSRRKPRKSREETRPELAVDEKKYQRYQKLAAYYMQTQNLPFPPRFDVIAITFIDNGLAHLHHLIAAFCAASAVPEMAV